LRLSAQLLGQRSQEAVHPLPGSGLGVLTAVRGRPGHGDDTALPGQGPAGKKLPSVWAPPDPQGPCQRHPAPGQWRPAFRAVRRACGHPGPRRGVRPPVLSAPACISLDKDWSCDQRLACLVPPKDRRLREPQLLGDVLAQAPVHELCVFVSHRVPYSDSRIGDDALAACRADRDEATCGTAVNVLALACSILASEATMRPPVAAKGWPAASDEPLNVQLGAVDRAESCVEAQPCPAELFVLPGGKHAEDCGREGLVDLVEVNIRQGESVPGEQPRHGERPEPSGGRPCRGQSPRRQPPRPLRLQVSEGPGRQPILRRRTGRWMLHLSAGSSCRRSWWRSAPRLFPKTGFSRGKLFQGDVSARKFPNPASGPDTASVRSSKNPAS
jgi:hypothetical protein